MKSDSYHPLDSNVGELSLLWRLFHVPISSPTDLSAPSPEAALMCTLAHGCVAMPRVFCRMPRKLYWLGKSTPPVTPTFGVEAAPCARAGAAAMARHPTVNTADTPQPLTARINDMN